MATTVGEASIKLAFDTEGVSKSLDKLKDIGGKVGKAVAVGIGAASTAVAGLATASIKAAADTEQLRGGIQTLFGTESIGSIEQFAAAAGKTVAEVQGDFDKTLDHLSAVEQKVFENAQNAYKTAGISANDYMDTVTSFSASLISSLGGDTAKAAEYANRAIVDMSDNANKMGTSMELIQNAYQGFAKQNYTMLDNLKLGYGGTKEEMARLISDASKLTDVQKELGVTVDASSMSFDNIVNAISVVQKNMNITGTTSKEAAGTISGSLNMLKASWSNMLVGMTEDGADFDTLFDNLIDSAMTFGDNILPAIERAMAGIGKFIEKAVPKLFEMIPTLLTSVLPQLIESATNLINQLIAQLPTVLSALTTAIPIIVTSLLNLVAQLLPQLPTIILQIVQAIINTLKQIFTPENLQIVLSATLQLLTGVVQAIPQIILMLIEALPDILMTLIEFFLDPANFAMLLDAGVQMFLALAEAVPKVIQALLKAFVQLFVKLWEKLKSVFTDFAANFGESLGNAIKGAINGVIGFIEQFINQPINAINGLIDVINSVPGISLGKLQTFQLARLAQGGLATGSTIANIGEAGKEAVIPLERNTDNWSGLLARSLAEEFNRQDGGVRPITVYMNNSIASDMDIEEVERKLMQSIRRAA